MSKDYERGVEQASAIYKEVIREYAAENAKLCEFASELMNHWKSGMNKGCLLCEREYECQGEDCYYDMKAEELGIEVQ